MTTEGQTQALVVQPQRELLPETEVLINIAKTAKQVVGTPFVPSTIQTEAAAFATILKGRELGIPAMASFAGIDIIKGRPSLKSELMLALIYRDHGDMAMRVVKSDDVVCTIDYKRRLWPSSNTFSFSIEDAKKAGLLNDASDGTPSNKNWLKRPDAMLRARCISAIARMAFPDSIGGLRTPDEVEEIAASEASVAAPVRQIAQQAVAIHEATPLHPSTGVVVGTVQANDDPPPAPRGRFYTDPQTGDMVPAPTPVACRLYAALRQQAEAESMNTIDPANLLTAEDMGGATNNLIAELAAKTTEGDGPASAAELKDLGDLFSAYSGAGVKLLTPEKHTAGVVRWLIATLTAVRNDVKKRAKAPEAAQAVA